MIKQLLKTICPLVLLFGFAHCGGGSGGGEDDPDVDEAVNFRSEIIVSNAAMPISVRQSPDGRIFFSELSTGKIKIVSDGVLLAKPFATVNVAGSGNEGLAGLAFDPNFSQNGFLYVYATVANPRRNQVIRFRANGNEGVEPTIILDNLPFGGHNGGRLEFDRGGKLLISVGDSGKPALAQDPSSLGGKILRINTDGTIPSDNPEQSSPIFASGLRNPFGLAVDPRNGSVFASDNGPDCDDELNLVDAGSNLGWRPDYACGENEAAFSSAVSVFNPSIAPTGIAFYRGNAFPQLRNQLLFADFLAGGLRRMNIEQQSGIVISEELLVNGEFGGLIDVHAGTDGLIYLATTSAIIRLVPAE